MQSESLFISDLHLSAGRPEVIRRFLDFIENRAKQSDHLYILGDWFDAYIGDDDATWPLNEIKIKIRALCHAGTKVYYLHGNRDFLLGDRFVQETGIQLLDEVCRIDLYGIPTLLTHGDLLCTDDVQYQNARIRVRSPEWQAHALSKPLWMRKLYARWYRFKSGLDKGGKTYEIMDVNADAVIEMMDNHQVKRLIHGHTHRPAHHTHSSSDRHYERFVLPEWDGEEYVLCFHADGFHQESLANL